jgi:hypothetical protein
MEETRTESGGGEVAKLREEDAVDEDEGEQENL